MMTDVLKVALSQRNGTWIPGLLAVCHLPENRYIQRSERWMVRRLYEILYNQRVVGYDAQKLDKLMGSTYPGTIWQKLGVKGALAAFFLFSRWSFAMRRYG